MTPAPSGQLVRLSADTATIAVDASVYSEAVVFKAFYWYGGDYDVRVESEPGALRVTLASLGGDISEERLAALASRVSRDLVDFRTRDIVARETQAVRELLVAKAFADVEGLASEPPGSAGDPVGFRLSDWEAP